MKQQVIETTDKVKGGNYTCQLPCQSNLKTIAGGCRDDVWIPYIAFTNLKYLPKVGVRPVSQQVSGPRGRNRRCRIM